MATAVTTTWNTVQTAYSSFTWSGNTYYITIELQAYYLPYSATQATIYLREKVTTSNSVGWSGTNKHYRLRFYPDEGGSGDSGYNQDATQWYAPGASYYLPDDWGSVHKVVDYGSVVSTVAYYIVDAAPSSEVAASVDIYVPNPTSPPTGLGANNLVPGAESFTANVYISSWGTGSGDKYRELQCWTYDASDFVQPRRYQPIYGDSLSGNITVDNLSKYSTAYGPLNITGNTRYTLGLYATNGSAATDSQRYTNAVTLAYAPEMTPSVVNDTTVAVNYTTKADGGYYSKTYEYSIDGGTTWTTFATVATGAASSGSFNLTGLTYGTEYTLLSRVTTTAGTNTGMPIKFSTKSKPRVYGSVSGDATRIDLLYGSVGGVAKPVKKLYGSVGGVAKRIY